MDAFTLTDQVRHFIGDEYLLGRSDTLTDDTSFLQDGILDSTGILQLIAFLETNYGIRVEDEELVPGNLDSIRLVSAYLSRKLNGSATPLPAGAHASRSALGI